MRRVPGAIAIAVFVLAAVAGGCKSPAPPVAPSLVSVYPSPDSSITALDRVGLEFNLPVKTCRLVALLRGTLPPPRVSGQSLGWATGATYPVGRWQMAVSGEVVFESGQSLDVREAWGFDLNPASTVGEVMGGIPSPTTVQAGQGSAFAVTMASRVTMREAPSDDATAVWEGPAGILLELGEVSGDHVRVSVPAKDAIPSFAGGNGSYPLPDVAGYMRSIDLWTVFPPWAPGVVETAVYVPDTSPRLVFAVEGSVETTTQFLISTPPSKRSVNLAVAYTLLTEAYLTLHHVPAPGPTELRDARPEDVDFLLEQSQAEFDSQFRVLSSLEWPTGLEQFRARILDLGNMYRDAGLAMLRMMDPALAGDARAVVARVIQKGGLTVPGSDAQVYEWGEAAGSALTIMVEQLRRDLRESMKPDLDLWEPSIGE